jgi:hypothetical protein
MRGQQAHLFAADFQVVEQRRDPMAVSYEIDLENYSLHKFKRSLQSREMIPSRAILKDDLGTNFKALEDYGITNLKELTLALKTKEKIEGFSQETGLTVEYLTLLNREARSYVSKPLRLDKLPGVSSESLDRLDTAGIRNTKQLFLRAQDKSPREQLAEGTGIPIEALNELVGLSDLSRIYGVGPVFARMIYDVGVHSVREFLNFSAEDFIRIYEEQTQKKADFGVAEIQFSLELAGELDLAAEI